MSQDSCRDVKHIENKDAFYSTAAIAVPPMAIKYPPATLWKAIPMTMYNNPPVSIFRKCL